MYLEKLLQALFLYSTDESAGATTETGATQDEATQDEILAPHKEFKTEDEFNNHNKSTASKAKKEMLDELGVKSIAEIKEKISVAQEKDAALTIKEQEMEDLKGQLTLATQDLALIKAGVADEFKTEALTLAKGLINEDTTLDKALEQVLNKMPIMGGAKITTDPVQIGSQKSTKKDDAVSDSLTKKFPWIK